MIGGKLHGVSRRAARLDKTNPTHLSYIEEIFTVSPSHNILEATARRLDAVDAVSVDDEASRTRRIRGDIFFVSSGLPSHGVRGPQVDSPNIPSA